MIFSLSSPSCGAEGAAEGGCAVPQSPVTVPLFVQQPEHVYSIPLIPGNTSWHPQETLCNPSSIFLVIPQHPEYPMPRAAARSMSTCVTIL